MFILVAEVRQRRLKFQPRQDQAEPEALLCLETASRPRRQDRGHIPANSFRSLRLTRSEEINKKWTVQQTEALFHIQFLFHLAQDPDYCQTVYYQ